MKLDLRRADFDHIGLITTEPHPDEVFVQASRAWVTVPRESPFHIEWVRFAPDSPLQGLVRTQPHVAFRVRDLDAAMSGQIVLAEPFSWGDGFCTVSFIEFEGAVIEFMQYSDHDTEKWIDDATARRCRTP